MKENLYRLWWAILVILVLLMSVRAIGDEPAATLTVTPHACLTPCTVRVQLRIPHDPNNKMWSISWNDGESMGELNDNSPEVLPECTQDNPAPCQRELRGAELYVFVGCVHRFVNDRIRPLCSTQTVEVHDE